MGLPNMSLFHIEDYGSSRTLTVWRGAEVVGEISKSHSLDWRFYRFMVLEPDGQEITELYRIVNERIALLMITDRLLAVDDLSSFKRIFPP